MIAFKIKCKCGKLLGVPAALAGKKVVCPGCRRAYRVPAQAGAPTTASPVASSPPMADSPSQLDLTSIDPASSPSELNLLDGVELQKPPSGPVCPGCKRSQPAGARICVTCGIDLATGASILADKKSPALELGYAGKGGRQSRGNAGRDTISGPARGYWADAFFSFVYPICTLNNSVTFFVLVLVVAFRAFLSTAGILGILGSIIISGWLASLYFSIVQETASGSNDLPGIKMEDGIVDDIIKPLFKYIGAIACALCPTALYLILMGTGVIPDFMQSRIIVLIWLAAGIFAWPFFVMLFAFDALAAIYRIDMMITTVFRTFLPYCALWLMLLVVGFGSLFSIIGVALFAAGFDIDLPELSLGASMLANMSEDAIGLFLTIVAMRQIGLYYLHFKNRFTFLFE
ncbi:MAG: hypothetical protein AABZ08_00345 [Planctomycetota bacterium]